MTLLHVDHIAIVVPDIEEGLGFWQTALGLSVDHRESLPGQEAIVAMLPVGATDLELVQPTTGTSGMARFLAKRGPGLHHICFKVDNMETILAQLKAQGIRLIHDEPIAGAGGRKVAFVHPQSACGVLVELVESDQPC